LVKNKPDFNQTINLLFIDTNYKKFIDLIGYVTDIQKTTFFSNDGKTEFQKVIFSSSRSKDPNKAVKFIFLKNTKRDDLCKKKISE